MNKIIDHSLSQHHLAILSVKSQMAQVIEAAGMICRSFECGGKLLLMGNGGSAADAQHIAAEFIGRFQKERRPLPAIALTTDTSILTALGNDYGFDVIFARQIQGLANVNDVILGISTSGNSKNIILGIQAAKEIGCFTVGLTGGAGQLGNLVDLNITIPDLPTCRVQEAHIFVGHLLCELLDQ